MASVAFMDNIAFDHKTIIEQSGLPSSLLENEILKNKKQAPKALENRESKNESCQRELCPQGNDCAGDGQHSRILDCEECGFRGCSMWPLI